MTQFQPLTHQWLSAAQLVIVHLISHGVVMRTFALQFPGSAEMVNVRQMRIAQQKVTIVVQDGDTAEQDLNIANRLGYTQT